ncbi:MAG: pyruvate:ferredoxin (flavodoxin) oxidoreductase [Polyangiaceae bacterium]
MTQRTMTVDANYAVADVAYRVSEVVAIYPITPASPMGEHADAWAGVNRNNVWGGVPRVAELQSEGGAAGAIHGAVQGGSLATTFTASQGLLLMIPNMYKIAGELTPCVIHVAARSLASHALSIFCDHSDVYAARSTGFAILGATTVQEAQDFAAVSHAATLESRIPFLHFFDGFRTSHEIAKITPIEDDTLRQLLDSKRIAEHRARALTPDHPVVRGTAHNPDTFFQAREAVNPYYDAATDKLQAVLDKFGELTGRRHELVSYEGHPEAEQVVIVMGSAAETARETTRHLAAAGRKVGTITLRLYRPFPEAQLLAALPASTKRIAVLDRTKEPGAPGEPLYLDVVSALARSDRACKVFGGRYGLSSKEVTPSHIAAIFDELDRDQPRHGFTLGIVDDVTHTSLAMPAEPLDIEPSETTRAIFWGLGSDGTVSASKSSVEIIGEETPLHAQGYFVYDSKKAGAVTISHLRFGPSPIHAPYLIDRASFVGINQWSFVDQFDVFEFAAPGATLLVNAPFPPEEVFAALPVEAQEQVLERKLTLHTIDAYAVAKELGLGRRINTIMQACFFALSGVLPRDEALTQIKQSIKKKYGKRGKAVVDSNFAAVDAAVHNLHQVPIPSATVGDHRRPPVVAVEAPELVQKVTAMMLARKGDLLPVSAFPPDGTWPTGTARWEKRNIALEIPVWDEDLCIQCNKCAMVCPHAAVRTKVYPEAAKGGAPETFKAVPFRSKDLKDMQYTVQIAPEDCTGCSLCVEVCPARDKSNPRHKALDMAEQAPLRAPERDNFAFFTAIPELPRDQVRLDVKHVQLFEPLFEFSGACAGCGETPYIKLLTQLYGDRLLIANATGCSSIYGGNLPTTPYTTNAAGRGPAWSNSLFEDNAEFGLGMRLAVERNQAEARRLLEKLGRQIDAELSQAILTASQADEAEIAAQRERVTKLREALGNVGGKDAGRLATLVDYLVDKSVWIVGGDGWAYDIGYGGLDHVLASGENINVLVLDTEVYSNTGGQQSKATPLGASAKFAAAGRELPKKDLGMLAMAYGNVYVAQVAFGGDDKQTLRAMLEAQSYPGPSLVIAYSHCIAHGYDLVHGLSQQKLAVESAYWPLYRFDPRRNEEGQSPLVIDSKAPKKAVRDFAYNETRFRLPLMSNPERAEDLMQRAEKHAAARLSLYHQLAQSRG